MTSALEKMYEKISFSPFSNVFSEAFTWYFHFAKKIISATKEISRRIA